MGTDGGSKSSLNSNSGSAPLCFSDGVIPRAVHELFHTRASLPSGTERVKVEMTYLEVLNAQVFDLLAKDASSAKLSVKLTEKEGVKVDKITRFDVSSLTDVMRLFEQASAKRKTAPTQMNAKSSRSHAVCTLNVTIAPDCTDDNTDPNFSRETISAKLTLVDLAGSERLKATRAEGDTKKEGIKINLGLSTLGLVVSTLSYNQGRQIKRIVPYRNSTLTLLLRDSLGGKSLLLYI